MVAFLSPVYQLIYHATYDWHKGFVYCVSCTILAVMFALTLYINFFMRRYTNRQKLKHASSAQNFSDSSIISTDSGNRQPSYKKYINEEEGL